METLISVAQVRIAAQHPLLWTHLSQGNTSQSTPGASPAQLGRTGHYYLLQIWVIAFNIFPASTSPGCLSPVFSLEGWCV